MNDRPTFTKWSRKRGGHKTCPACNHRHKPVMRVDGAPCWVKVCVQCGADLPSRLTYPRRSTVKWYVREFDPLTGKTRDHACRSSEHADELIRKRQRDFTRDPIQQQLIESTSAIIRGLEADTIEDGLDQLIEKLGGDTSRRKVKGIAWDAAVKIIGDELHDKGLSDLYVANMARAASDLRTITGLEDWSKLDLDAISRFRRVRLAGGWQRKNRTVRPADPRTVNGDLRALRAFLSRAVTKGWVRENVLKGAADEWVKVKSIRVDYMPDSDLRTLIDSASEPWLRTFIVIAYYTGARRSDLLRLQWDTDIDLTGEKIGTEGGTGPHIFIRGSKADTPRWAPLHPCAVQALEALRREPIVDRNVFPMRESRDPASFVSHRFARLCREAGLATEIVQSGKGVSKARWTLHSLRRKANTDLRDRGASPKERVELLGQRTTAVNEKHYEAIRPDRARALIDALPTFEMVG